jgi:hypothetical protein
MVRHVAWYFLYHAVQFDWFSLLPSVQICTSYKAEDEAVELIVVNAG